MTNNSENLDKSNQLPYDDVSETSKKNNSGSVDDENDLDCENNNKSNDSKGHGSKNFVKDGKNDLPESLSKQSSITNLRSRNSRVSNTNYNSQTSNGSLSSLNSRILPNSQSSESKREQALQDEATRLFCEMASDPDIMDQAFSAAVNPNVAMELARQADTAWRNIETLPGGFRALCQMHHNLQQPLWNAVIGQDIPKVSRYHNSEPSNPPPNQPIKAEPMPNPWKTESQSSNSSNLPFPFSDFNPFRFSNFNETLPGHSGSSRGQRNEVLSEVINRTRPNSFQTASQLIQNSSSRYSKEMEELAEMGITDREKCLTALEAADGDLFQALGILQSLDELDKEESNNK